MSSPTPSKRSAGLLLHPTSLPGPYGIGDLGPAAFAWVDALAKAKQKWWQILPLGPTGYGDSPYQCFSAFAGNPYLISPELLVQDGLLKRSDLGQPHFPGGPRRFRAGDPVQAAAARPGLGELPPRRGGGPASRSSTSSARPRRAGSTTTPCSWPSRRLTRGKGWLDWPVRLVRREPAALQDARKELSQRSACTSSASSCSIRQWRELKKYANQRASGSSATCRSSSPPTRPTSGRTRSSSSSTTSAGRRVVAGVPPDYFSATGQLWGNPLYDWERDQATGYAWWVARLKATLAAWSTWSGSTTSAASRPTGKSRPACPRPRRAAGSRGPASTSSTRLKKPWAGCR